MADKIIQNKIFRSIYIPLLLVLAFLVRVYRVEVYGAGLFVLITAAMLILSSRLTDAMLPTLMLVVFATRLYDFLNNEVWMKQLFQIIWVAVPVLFALIFHFVYYRKPFRIGRSFFGLCAISVSLILGGLGTIPVKDYFSGTALFYVFGLGLLMVVFYMLIKPHFNSDSWVDLVDVMYVVGISATLFVVSMYIENWNVFVETNRLLGDGHFQSSNNISTILMIAMPFPLYYAHKNPIHIFPTLFMYMGILFTNSRGGLLMGTVELGIILLAYVVVYPKNKKERIIAISSSVFLVICVCCTLPMLVRLLGLSGDLSSADGAMVTFEDLVNKVKGYFFNGEQARVKLLYRMFEDFKTNPIFGVGIGYKGNSDVYNPVSGAMNWYHMWFAQVIGGLGVLGILTYGYQLVDRVIIFFKNRTTLTWTLMLSYVGLFLMSQLNPGEFCPMPYAMIGVTLFVVMENIYEKKMQEDLQAPVSMTNNEVTETVAATEAE